MDSGIFRGDCQGALEGCFVNAFWRGIAALFCSTAFLFAEKPSDSVVTSGDRKFQRFAAMPVLGYSEETGLKYGAMLLLFSRPEEPGGDASSLDLIAMGTTKGQVEVNVSPDLYLFGGKIHSDVSLVYWNWRAKFYGIGNDPDRDDFLRYDMDLFKLYVPVDIGILAPPRTRMLSVGPYLYFETNRVSFRKGELSRPEFGGGLRTGLGFQATIDLRDNVNWPESGAYAGYRQIFYAKAFGGDYDFFSQTFDLRAYSHFIWNTSIALGAFYDMRKGDVPFDMLSTLDGVKRFRGVERGLFLDRQSLSAQLEFRKKLLWRLAGTLFVEAGKVGPYFSELWKNDLHYAAGFGGRLLLNRSEKTYARCDFSLVDGKYFGLTIYLREAF